MQTLSATKNKYGGMSLDPHGLPQSGDEFAERLSISMQFWKSEGVKVVWLPLISERSHLIPVANRLGFEYHHCTGCDLLMVRRLEADAVIPSFATHTIGVGAVVLSDNSEILTIVEQRDMANKPDNYKFPGGMLEPGEHLAQGVVREVIEETAIKTEFDGLVSFRHHHGGQFGTSNIYAVCLLKPLSHDISIDRMEIGKALWMPVEDFLKNAGVGPYNKHVLEIALNPSRLQSKKIDGYMNSKDDYEIFSPRV